MARGGKGYSAVQFACAALHLLDSKHHAVSLCDMELLLGRFSAGGSTCSEESAKEAGNIALESIVRVNALSMRPHSDWALDIPLEAYLSDDPRPEVAPGASALSKLPVRNIDAPNIDTIITAPSASALHCMGRLRPQLEKKLRSIG